MESRGRLVVVVLLVLGASAACTGGGSAGTSGAAFLPATSSPSPDPAGARRSVPVPNEKTLSVGVSHTRYSIDAASAPAAAARASQVLRATASYQNQHIMGFGAGNPEPAPGRYDWASLDQRMDLIRRTGGTPVITLCCAPDWMKGGKAGATDWNRLELAPDADHYDDFARLAGAVARRYPWVRHYQVWNELKGFWDATRQRWDYEGYTALYNKVYRQLKAVNPQLKVGGPYVVMQSFSSVAAAGDDAARLSGAWGVMDQRALDVVTYWLRHKRGADFLVIDGGSQARDRELVTDQVAATLKLADVTAWLRSRTSIPIWWAELYFGTRRGAGEAESAAVALAGLARLLAARASVALIWQPEDDPGARFISLWTSTRDAAGGRPTALATGMQHLQAVLAEPAADGPSVRWVRPTLAVLRGGGASMVLNASGQPLELDVEGERVALQPWSTRQLGPLPADAQITPRS